MQLSKEGEFYSENTFRNYKIPHRSSKTSINESGRNEMGTPLADSYYNYSYELCYQNSHSNAHQSKPGPATQPTYPNQPGHIDPIKQNIFETLKQIKEKPKSQGASIFERTVPDLLDETLPKELKLLFQPLYCKLCTVQLSSNQTAKLHYMSKNHEKKIRKWLTEWAEKTGQPLPKRALLGNEKKCGEAEKNPSWFYCEVCDLELTGKLHSESHYMGKNHQKALLGHKAPAGSGYYDKDGKWVRVRTQKSKIFNLEEGEDNFGLDFKAAVGEPIDGGDTCGQPPAKKRKEAIPLTTSKFHCEVCDVNTTCQEQLETHYRGQKHQKKLKQLGLDSNKEGDVIGLLKAPIESPVDLDINLSIYRTPTGDYYCPTCNTTTNSEGQFLQHMKSKGHAKKSLTQKK